MREIKKESNAANERRKKKLLDYRVHTEYGVKKSTYKQT